MDDVGCAGPGPRVPGLVQEAGGRALSCHESEWPPDGAKAPARPSSCLVEAPLGVEMGFGMGTGGCPPGGVRPKAVPYSPQLPLQCKRPHPGKGKGFCLPNIWVPFTRLRQPKPSLLADGVSGVETASGLSRSSSENTQAAGLSPGHAACQSPGVWHLESWAGGREGRVSGKADLLGWAGSIYPGDLSLGGVLTSPLVLTTSEPLPALVHH